VICVRYHGLTLLCPIANLHSLCHFCAERRIDISRLPGPVSSELTVSFCVHQHGFTLNSSSVCTPKHGLTLFVSVNSCPIMDNGCTLFVEHGLTLECSLFRRRFPVCALSSELRRRIIGLPARPLACVRTAIRKCRTIGACNVLLSSAPLKPSTEEERVAYSRTC